MLGFLKCHDVSNNLEVVSQKQLDLVLDLNRFWHSRGLISSADLREQNVSETGNVVDSNVPLLITPWPEWQNPKATVSNLYVIIASNCCYCIYLLLRTVLLRTVLLRTRPKYATNRYLSLKTARWAASDKLLLVTPRPEWLRILVYSKCYFQLSRAAGMPCCLWLCICSYFHQESPKSEVRKWKNICSLDWP